MVQINILLYYILKLNIIWVHMETDLSSMQ